MAIFAATAHLLGACRRLGEPSIVSHPCGQSVGSASVDGFIWLAGSPTQANGLCEIRQQQPRLLLALDPESRDPQLFNDQKSGRSVLVERFSGRQARPSRVTWFSSQGEKLGQRGDWPQNVYGISLTDAGDALVTGFDFGVLQRIQWQGAEFATPSSSELRIDAGTSVHPIHTLSEQNWFAVVDNGYDLTKYTALEAKVFVFRAGTNPVLTKTVELTDPQSGIKCRNAFQTLAISSSEVLVSCNPQYFGPKSGETVAAFKVTLEETGDVSVREMVHFDGNDIQRIDLWGVDVSQQFAFFGYKKTTIDNYEGTVARAGWMKVDDLTWIPEQRFAGPVHWLASGSGSVVACSADSQECSKGQFIYLSSKQPWSSPAIIQKLELNPELPFLSFAHELRGQ